jgi:hypothetical protein
MNYKASRRKTQANIITKRVGKQRLLTEGIGNKNHKRKEVITQISAKLKTSAQGKTPL